jgi:CHRD domain
MGKVALRALVLVTVIGLLGVGSYAIAGGGAKNFKGLGMEGYQENPDVSTVATGDFKAFLSDDGTKLDFELSYSGLEAPVLFAHVHFGKAGVNGGVSYFLCGGGGKPACPQEGTVTGEIVAADVIGPTGQGIAPGEFAEILAAMRAGHTYANVHSSKFPGGEIRAQINDRGRN